ncbi:hypothetical protein [Thalassotalea sp. ND16A]|uniref:hypothetical protein n=1 Tax=Thalassotalea sp. ND16A TaxID=1535422 RepID=UPI00051D6A1F|nr:hypothetical protein [Thalassotalea sp. ND16A]KGJ97140.1 hypothetical protein ND16A_0062 [Thalassotalea sp. ND16A]
MVNNIVNNTVNQAAATVATGVFGLLGSLLLSGFVGAAPMLSEQEASSEPVLETIDVNNNAIPGKALTTTVPSQVTSTTAASAPVANGQQSSDDDNTGQLAKGDEPQAKQVASTIQKRSVITLESTIVGDKEQPTVLTLVPWQKPEHESVISKPVSRQIEMKFTALEVDSLKRELHYYQKSKQ